jgi:hypothetical protein
MIKIFNEHLEKYCKEHIIGVQSHINYDALSSSESKYIKENIKHILGAKPNEFQEILNDETLKKIDKEKLTKAFVGGYPKDKKGGLVGYAKFIKKDDNNYDAYRLAEKLQVNVCPYCNINSTFTVIEEENKKITRPEFDHFYDKATNPILALSFYNLIPSCHICNATLKGSEEFSMKTHINPYSDSLDELAKFHLKIEDSTFYHSIDGFDLKLETEDERATNQIKIFELETLYQNHKDIILELIQKEAIYNESYLDELLTQYEGTLFKNREDLQRLISGGYVSDEEIGK